MRRLPVVLVAPAEPQVFDFCDGDPTFPLGETIVIWTVVDDDGNQSEATQKVIVEDREAPSMLGSANVKTYCDNGQIFATVDLPQPEVVDNVTEEPALAGKVPKTFPVGATKVTWTARDDAGNESSRTTTVTVVNRSPLARAGSRSVWTTVERGARVDLDGGRSTDPDGQPLKFEWDAGDVKIAGFKRPQASGPFPVGSTQVTLTVTDPLGLTKTKHLRVLVRLKNSKPRPKGTAATASLAAALGAGGEATRRAAPSRHRAQANAHAAEATRIGLIAGDSIV